MSEPANKDDRRIRGKIKFRERFIISKNSRNKGFGFFEQDSLIFFFKIHKVLRLRVFLQKPSCFMKYSTKQESYTKH